MVTKNRNSVSAAKLKKIWDQLQPSVWKGRTFFISGHEGQGQKSHLLKIEILFPERNSRRRYGIKLNIDIWLVRTLFILGHVRQGQRSLMVVNKNRNSVSVS